MTRPTYALISLDHLRHNYRLAKQKSVGSSYAVIKANAYGHGLLECARALPEADGFVVARVDEGVLLRQGGISQVVVVLQGACSAEEWQEAARHQLQLVIHHEQQLAQAESLTLSDHIQVWLKINTGMNRLGVRPEEAQRLIMRIQASQSLHLAQVMTHFASADTGNSREIDPALAALDSQSWPAALSVNNSAALLTGLANIVESNESVSRPGIMLYGSSPLLQQSADELNLKPVMTLNSQIIHTHQVKAGESVGYGADWQAPKDSRIAVIAIGYGDGYPRQARQGTPVLVDGIECPLIGRVSMDMITVDVSAHPGAGIGTPVELWGERLEVDRVAHYCDTIAYELFCQLTPRVKRVYQ